MCLAESGSFVVEVGIRLRSLVSIVLFDVSWEAICEVEDVLFSRLVPGSESSLTALHLGFLNIPISFFLHHRIVDGALVYHLMLIVARYLFVPC